MTRRPARTILLLLLTLTTLPVWPLATDREQPIRIEADRLEIDESARQSSYSGHVVMEQGSLRIEADRILFIFDASNDLLRLEIEGQPARLQQTGDDGQPLSGEALRMTYHNRKGLLELEGKARLKNGGDVIESERIRFNIETNALEAGDPQAKENGRVRMVIQPASGDTAKDKASPPRP